MYAITIQSFNDSVRFPEDLHAFLPKETWRLNFASLLCTRCVPWSQPFLQLGQAPKWMEWMA